MNCERNATYCHYNYVIFCYYNRDFQFYHTICEPFLNNTQVKMISVSAIKTSVKLILNAARYRRSVAQAKHGHFMFNHKS